MSIRSGMRGQLLPVEGLRQCGRKVCGTHQRQCRSDLTRVMRAQLELMACVRRPATSNNRRSMSVAKLAAAMPTKTARRLVLFPEVPSRLRRPTCSARLPSSRWGGRCARSRLRTLPAHVMEDCGLGEEVIGNRFSRQNPSALARGEARCRQPIIDLRHRLRRTPANGR